MRFSSGLLQVKVEVWNVVSVGSTQRSCREFATQLSLRISSRMVDKATKHLLLKPIPQSSTMVDVSGSDGVLAVIGAIENSTGGKLEYSKERFFLNISSAMRFGELEEIHEHEELPEPACLDATLPDNATENERGTQKRRIRERHILVEGTRNETSPSRTHRSGRTSAGIKGID